MVLINFNVCFVLLLPLSFANKTLLWSEIFSLIHLNFGHPLSMLITYDDSVKISDFGTSKELSDKSTKMSFAGTVAWMAPEVIRNEPVSEKVDIW